METSPLLKNPSIERNRILYNPNLHVTCCLGAAALLTISGIVYHFVATHRLNFHFSDLALTGSAICLSFSQIIICTFLSLREVRHSNERYRSACYGLNAICAVALTTLNIAVMSFYLSR